MDHSDVVRLQAVEKYVLGELAADLRNEFEEHYFDCNECATDVRSLATFMTTARAVLKETVPSRAPEPVRTEGRKGWLAWLRPAIALPAMATLALVIVYQNTITIPGFKQQIQGASSSEVFGTSYHVQGATRGENVSKVPVSGDESFALDFDFTPAVPYESYTGRLVDGSGRAVMSFRIEGEMANKEIHLVIPEGRVQAGNYDLVFLGESNGPSKDVSSREVQRISFVIENRP